MTQFAPYCFVSVTDQKALDAINESGTRNGSFKDRHPWLIAQELLELATSCNQSVPLIFAVEPELRLSDWSLVRDIEVMTYSGQAYETKCTFENLRPVNPIFEALDSMVLMPSKEQLHRESREPIRTYRQHLDEVHLYPYAICETPAFVHAEVSQDATASEG